MNQVEAADRRLQRLVREFFPVGDRVQWAHGRDVRSGVVTDVSGHSADMLRFRVESDASGRAYWVHASCLLSFIGLR